MYSHHVISKAKSLDIITSRQKRKNAGRSIILLKKRREEKKDINTY